MALLDPACVRGAALDALAVLAPTACSGCGLDDRALCGSCVAALQPAVTMVTVDSGRPLPVHCGLRYEGVVRRVLLAVKESGRTDATPALAAAARAAVTGALRTCRRLAAPADGADAGTSASTVAGGSIRLATIPSTRAAFRARGYHPTELILAQAGLRASHPLRTTRQTRDQAALGVDARSANRQGSLQARHTLTGRMYILVDDILTTGATLCEARRAIEAAGGVVLAAAVVANTERRHGTR
ncbi:MAG: ComF family protein [Microbacteriaceae bacterium]|nr:MAG: ComF family protein [Microbacteriaceae bacterium]